MGYKWRVWFYEMMDYTDEVKAMILDGKSAFEIWNYALAQGMIDLERDGIFKTIEWQTTLDEVYRFVKVKNL
jgi:type II secretory ATPase GspE/PulE/Tfp pilus assembly ATPase PilB-like protein